MIASFRAEWLRPLVRDRLGIEPGDRERHRPALSRPLELAELLTRDWNEVTEAGFPIDPSG